MTPEGEVKKAVKKVFERYGTRVYTHWPVLNGMGKPTLDCTGCVNGWYFAVETKRPGERPTWRQGNTRKDMEAAGATVFVIDAADSFALSEFAAWLEGKLNDKFRSSDLHHPRRESGTLQQDELPAGMQGARHARRGRKGR